LNQTGGASIKSNADPIAGFQDARRAVCFLVGAEENKEDYLSESKNNLDNAGNQQ
jgi:hypothetical protein